MIYTIKNEKITVAIDSKGAQIQSIYANNREYMWEGDPLVWGKKAPILFPIVGRLLNNKTYINNNEFEIERHGFLKHTEFTLTNQTNEEITLKTTFNEETLKIYPFKFSVYIKFYLKNDTFHCEYEIKNVDTKNMPFQFGLHPGFSTKDLGDFNKLYLKFDKKTCINTPNLDENLMADFNNTTTILENSDTLKLSHNLFYNDAIIIKNPNFKNVALYNENGKIFDFSFENFDIFALWQPKNSNLICFEPWTSLAGVTPHPKNFIDNQTNKIITANSSFLCNMYIKI